MIPRPAALNAGSMKLAVSKSGPANTPPIAGPNMNPKLNAEPRIPMLLARSAPLDTSAT